MTSRAKRRKRDSVDNLYRQCKITGQCPDDVINKVEGNTLADRLLKILGSVIYLGGLGIGTGRGTGGSTGYRPIGATTPRVTDSIPVRPTVPVDPLVPTDILPVDPTGPSIVPLTESGLPEDIIVETGGTSISSGPLDPAVITEIDPISDVTGVEGQPTIVTNEDDTVAVLDVQPTTPAPKKVTVGARIRNAGHIEPSVLHPIPESSAVDFSVFVDAQVSGDTIGAESIPLQDFNEIEQFEIEELGPRTSTPEQRINRAFQRARDLYNRQITQIRTRNLDFLGPVSRAVQFDFENPAFDGDVTLQFEQDVRNVTAAPDTDFRDVITMHRPRYSTTDTGRVRVSRLGRRGTIQTRSGAQIGENVHFYFDVSTIGSDATDAIELSTLGQHSGDSAIVDGLAESTFINHLENADTTYTEEDLLDNQIEDFEGLHLILSSSGRRGQVYSIPTLPPGTPFKIFVDDYGRDLFVSYPVSTSNTDVLIPQDAEHPLEPPIILDFQSNDYYLHPSLWSKRRKRKLSDIYNFFTDGAMDAAEW
ncbi:L2 [Gammapapillomavirus 24]|uniref:Minor capsid protein L2 n=1 Tax=Gammapapillomavirus 24 TaxID=1961681 RepID=A0A2D2AMN4_9PAPI|nr:L2 [Gammapapillomavirus 24]